MKLLDFFHKEEIYKSSKEGHFPFLLGFVRNCKIMVFKDLGPNHLQISKLRSILGEIPERIHGNNP